MNFPKLVIASDGEHTGALLDGVFIGQGIERLEFSTQNKNGEMKSIIRIMDLNVGYVKIKPNNDQFPEFLERLSGKD